MLKLLISLILNLCIVQSTIASRMDIESHINLHNHSGTLSHGDKDHDRDGDVEADRTYMMKPILLLDFSYVKHTLSIVVPEIVEFVEVFFAPKLLHNQSTPVVFLRPPISVL